MYVKAPVDNTWFSHVRGRDDSARDGTELKNDRWRMVEKREG